MTAPSPARWLLLIHRVPAKPDYLRVKLRRQPRGLGAVPIKNSVYVLPAPVEVHPRLAGVARGILQRGGEAQGCEDQLIEGLADGHP